MSTRPGDARINWLMICLVGLTARDLTRERGGESLRRKELSLDEEQGSRGVGPGQTERRVG